MTAARLPTYFLSHGGGPWPFMDGPGREAYRALETSLKAMLPGDVGRLPKAILVVSSHWEEAEFAVSSSPAPNSPQVYYRSRPPSGGSMAMT